MVLFSGFDLLQNFKQIVKILNVIFVKN